MELHSPVVAKRLWSYLRVAFFMLRKGLISKRKLIMDLNLMMKKRGKLKLIGKTLGNHVFSHHRARSRRHGYSLQEYEFSCNNTPSPVFFHAKRNALHSYFPCIRVVVEKNDEGPPTVRSDAAAAGAVGAAALPRLCYSPNMSMVSSEEDEDDRESGVASFGSDEVDYEAEKFIKRFYEQLRRQSRFALLQYEMDYQEMLDRGH